MDYEIFDLGDVALQSGVTLPGAFLAYKTYGSLNDKKTMSSSIQLLLAISTFKMNG